ncbi:site-specific integrase [Flavobacterium amniphilum]|uniref:phage integrase SAM-like domain-containing protein n=1 Tax=Flavobacterium amniphilum TaxID=1834035 RepID=UPI00202A0A05|nr:phage integrase SAM-like domain-containing protein [Flavobacterium amniphilum]MCL9804901.1 site-specific integrase [Flavobacterium amniphilum]
MATSKFRIKTSNDWNTIFYRFKHSNKFDIECSTGIQIPNKRWSNSKQEVLQTNDINFKEINLKLKDLDSKIRKDFEDAKLKSETINTNWLKTKINVFFNRETNNDTINSSIFLTNYIVSFIEESKTKKTRNNTPVKPRTIQHYNTTLNKIIAFEEHIGSRVKLTDITISFHTKFLEFLENKQKLNPNTIGGYIDDIKLFCNNADKKDIQISKEFKLSEFYTPSNKTKDVYLKEDEINSIFSSNFEQDYLDNARDWLIIGLRTGFRISDFLKLTKKNLIHGFIEKQTIKTDFPVIIPIHNQVKYILEKRNGDFPRRISDQKFNDYIKIICKEVGISEIVEGAKIVEIEIKENGKKKKIHRKQFGKFPKHELVTSHICRRSFATNLYGKIDTLTIMKITGHQTEAQFLSYIKITPREYAEKLKAYWKNASTIMSE